jgi:hypothetical protein
MTSCGETADDKAIKATDRFLEALATDRFVEALANVLQASKGGSASIPLRTELAAARANAEKLLSTKQYSEAVFKAARISDCEWD